MQILPYGILKEIHMGVFNNFPYTNIHELNLDWILEKLKEVLDDNKSMSEQIDAMQYTIDNLPLEQEVRDQLTEWLNDGTLANIINQTAFNQLRTDIDANTASINTLNSRLSLVDSPKILFIGDSYLAGSQLDPTDPVWADICAQKMGLTLNSSYWKYAHGGDTFGNTDLTYNYITRLYQAVSDLTTEQKNSITHIIVGGGANEYNYASNPTAIGTGMVNFYNVAVANFPNAKIFVVALGWAKDSARRAGILSANYTMASVTLNPNKFMFIDDVYCNLQNDNRFSADGVHPNVDGQRRLGASLYNVLMGSPLIVLDENIDAPITFGGGTRGYCRPINNKYMHIKFIPGTITFDSPKTIATTEVDLGVCTCYRILGQTSVEGGAYVPVRAIANGNVAGQAVDLVGLSLRFAMGNDDKVHIMAQMWQHGVTPGGDNFERVSASALTFGYTDTIIPIEYL